MFSESESEFQTDNEKIPVDYDQILLMLMFNSLEKVFVCTVATPTVGG